MNKYYIDLPEGLHFLEDYGELEPMLFNYGTCILNKAVTGCGATTMFLDDPLPTILCSPRKALMFCKANSPRFKGKIYLFRNETDPDDASVIELENRMMEYIRECDKKHMPPKILVSYDSFRHVVQRLTEDGSLGRYQIIVDEAQALFTDAAFKGDVSIEFLENLQGKKNRIIFMSATPYLEAYLDMLPQFQSLPYVQLVWQPSSLQPTNIVKKGYYRGSLAATVKRIIDKYRTEGFFEEKVVNGNYVCAREALFFVNNVRAITGIIKSNGLTPADTTVICAMTEKNRKALQQLGFTIGHAPQEDEPGPRPPFTFVTKCSFEGTDFWTQAYTYIFSDITVNTMVVDIALDLPQIMGRQRDETNPFKYDATFYFKTDPSFVGKTDEEIQADISKKERVSKKWIANFNAADPEVQENLAEGKRDQQERLNFTKDYVAVIDDAELGVSRVAFNSLAQCNEIRAWELRKTTYFNGCLVLRAIQDISVPDIDYPLTDSFLATFTGDFENRMKAYCVFLDQHPEYLTKLESLPQIPMEMKEYYRTLGHAGISAESYVESGILRRIGITSRQGELDAEIVASFVPGKFYSNPEAKLILQGIYNRLRFPLTAKATDLVERQNVRPVKKVTKTVDGKRVEGYLVG